MSNSFQKILILPPNIKSQTLQIDSKSDKNSYSLLLAFASLTKQPIPILDLSVSIPHHYIYQSKHTIQPTKPVKLKDFESNKDKDGNKHPF